MPKTERGAGHRAVRPAQIPARGWMAVAWRVKEELAADKIALIAAGVAFYGILSLFPLITAVVALSGLAMEPTEMTDQVDQLAVLMPDAAADIVLNQVREVASSSGGALGLAAIASILVSIYSGSKAIDNLIQGLNVAYEETEKRGFFKLKLTVIGLTVALVIGIGLCLGVVAVIPAVIAWFGDGQLWATVAQVLRWPVLFGLGAVGITLLYRWGPSRDPAKWRWLAPGSVIACAVWVIGSIGFAWYVQNFGSYNETFGALGGVIILLMWLWISAYAVLLGAEIDAELEAQTARDTTRGPREPMGERDATKADTVVSGS